ncbi:phosphoglycerate kinase [Chloroflexota bacterium]
MNKMTVRDIEVSGKRALVRVDFNVPLDEKTGEIIDDSRIRAALSTIKYLIERGAKVVLMSHFGRPKGKVVDELRMADIGERLSQILRQPVAVAKDCIGSEVEELVTRLENGDVLLLENLRFHPGEESNDAPFAKSLARLGDVFVDDAFGAAHRAHASISGITDYLPAVAGFLMEKEIENLGSILENPAHPFAALLGGAKISDKISILNNIMGKVDLLLVGGGMAATFLKAQSYEVGLSLIEPDMLNTTTSLIKEATKKGTRLLLPVDVMVADKIDNESKANAVTIENIPESERIVDIGPQTINNFSRELQNCRTVFWNGPMGIYEIPRFAKGTQEMARLLANLDAATIIGGGSTADVVNEMELADKMTFVSTGGGASLEFLGGEKLPGVEALRDKK